MPTTKLKRCLALFLLSIFSLPAFSQTGEPEAGGAAETETVPGSVPSTDPDDTDPDDTGWDDSEVFYLGGITVTGTRSEKRLADTPVATEIIGAQEISDSSATTLTEVLDDYGLMYSSNAMGDYIQLQGLGESRVLYLIDGRRVPGRVAGRLNGSTLPLDNVERIEILRGPQSALYGSDGIGGVVNIITKKPGDSFSLSAGVSNSFIVAYDDPATSTTPGPFDNIDPFREQKLSASLGLPLGPTRNTLSLNFSRSGLYLDQGERTSILPRYLRGQGSLDTSLTPTTLSDLRLGGGFMFLQSDHQTNVAGSISRSDYIRADGFLSYELFPLPDLALSFRLYDNYYQRDRSAYTAITSTWANTNQFENENTATLEAAGTWAGFSRWLLSGGLETSYHSMRKFNLTEQVKGVDTEALYVQAERFTDGVYSVLGGFRIERNSQYGFSAAPKVSAMYHLPQGFRILGSAGVGYRAPNFNDLYLVKDDPPHPLILGNPDLKPEYAVNTGAGLEYAHQRGSATVNGYYTELFEEIAYVDTGRVERGMVVYDTGNLSRSLRAGLDTEGKVSFLTWGYASAGYSYVFAWDRTAETELHPQPAHTVKFRLGLDTGRAGSPKDGAASSADGSSSPDAEAPKKITLHAWAGGRVFSAIETIQSKGDTRLVLDAYAAVTFIPHFKVYLSADNLLGTIDQFFGPAVPQTFSLGLNYTY